MKRVGLTNMSFTVDVAEDVHGDEPRIVLALGVAPPARPRGYEHGPDNFHLLGKGPVVFDTGIVGEGVGDGSDAFSIPLHPSWINRPGLTTRYEHLLDDERDEMFLVFAQAWDDDGASDSKKQQNRKALHDSMPELTFQPPGVEIPPIRHKFLEIGDVGTDDLLGQDGQMFYYDDGSDEDFSLTLTGEDDDAKYTLRGTVTWQDA